MTKIDITDLGGGLNLQEPSTLLDNQFEILNNFNYNADGRLQTRRGIKSFGNPVDSNAPQTSYFFYKNAKTGLRTGLLASGTKMYVYNEGTSDWDTIKTGLTEFETDGVTRTRWSFTVYLEKIYMCNGVDDYAEYDAATDTYTVLGAQPKVRYLAFLGDAIYGAGDDDNPHLLYITNAGAVDGKTLDANELYIGGETDGRINGIEELQQAVLVFKDKKVYNIAGDLSSATALDAENGGYGERSIKRVGNSLIYFNDRGFNTLKAKTGITGTTAIQDTPLSDDVRQLTRQVSTMEYNSTIGNYILPLTNYYGSFDTGSGGAPETTLVYSTLQQAWSRHIYPSHYDYGQYEDNDGLVHYIMTSATSNQVFEMEVGFQDLSSPIEAELLTKRFDLGEAMVNKTHTAVDIQGLKSEGGEIEVEIIVDGEVVGGSTITDDYINTSAVADLAIYTIGTETIGTQVIGGGEATDSEIDLYKYFIRLPLYELGSNIQIRMTSNTKAFVWGLDKLSLHIDKEDVDLFDYSNIG